MRDKNKFLNVSAAVAFALVMSGCSSSDDKNTAPIFNSESYTFELYEDGSVTNAVAATDAESDDLTYGVGSSPENGKLNVNADGSFSYTPVANFNGTDSAALSVTDGNLTATVNLIFTVVAQNDAPVIDSVSTSIDGLDTMNGVIAASDIEGDSLTYSIVTAPSIGSVEIDSASGTFIYTAENIASVVDSFEVAVSDGELTASKTVDVTASYSTNEQKQTYYYASESSNLNQALALIENSDEENDLYIADSITANDGYVGLARGYVKAGFLTKGIEIVEENLIGTESLAIAYRKLAEEVNALIVTINEQEGANNSEYTRSETTLALVTAANELRTKAIENINLAIAVSGLENLTTTQSSFYRDTIRNYLEIDSYQEALALVDSVRTLADSVADPEVKYSSSFQKLLAAIQSLSDDLTTAFLDAPTQAHFDNAMLAIEFLGELAEQTSFNENSSGDRYYTLRTLYLDYTVMFSHFVSLAADGDNKTYAETISKEYLAKALSMYTAVSYDENYVIDANEYAETTTSKYPTGLYQLAGPFAALYQDYILANSSDTATGNIPVDLVVLEEVKMTDNDVEKAYRDHFAGTILVRAQNGESFADVIAEAKTFFENESADEEYVFETLIEQDAVGYIDKRAAWFLHYSGLSTEALSLVDEALAYIQTDAYIEKDGNTFSKVSGSEGCYQLISLAKEFGASDEKLSAITDECVTLTLNNFGIENESLTNTNIRLAHNMVTLVEAERGNTEQALAASAIALTAAQNNEDFDDFIEEHFDVANALVTAGLLTESLSPLKTALATISTELTNAADIEAQVDIIDDALSKLSGVTKRGTNESNPKVYAYYYGLKMQAGSHQDYVAVLTEAEAAIVATLDELTAALADTAESEQQDSYSDLIEHYAFIGQYERAISLVQSEVFEEGDIDDLLIEVVDSWASHDDFPATSAALVDSDQDGLPNFFLTTASELQIESSQLTADDDSDNDGTSDEQDLTPLDPNN